jgi:hypothetical protein
MPPRPIGDVPPDHPMFHRGVSFVSRSDLPAEQDHEDDEQSVDSRDEQQPEND